MVGPSPNGTKRTGMSRVWDWQNQSRLFSIDINVCTSFPILEVTAALGQPREDRVEQVGGEQFINFVAAAVKYNRLCEMSRDLRDGCIMPDMGHFKLMLGHVVSITVAVSLGRRD